MITKQRLYKDGDKICLRNTVDCSAYVDAAKRVNECDSGGWFGDKNERMQLMGYIPPELWGYNPWLIMARREQREGNIRKYTEYVQKFFSLYQAFKVNHKRTTWHGCGAVLL